MSLTLGAAMATAMAFGAGTVGAATVTITATSFGAGAGADVAAALAAQNVFHGGGARVTEDFEGFNTGPSGTALQTAVGTFIPLGPVGTGSTNLTPNAEAQIRDGSGKNGGRFNTTSGGKNYLDSNDNGGIRLEVPGQNQAIGAFSKLSFLATDIDDVNSAQFSITALGTGTFLTTLTAGSLGKFPSGTLHLFTFLFSAPVFDIGLDLKIDKGDGFSVDSFIVSAVPLPAAGLLMLSGLAALGLGARRRRHIQG